MGREFRSTRRVDFLQGIEAKFCPEQPVVIAMLLSLLWSQTPGLGRLFLLFQERTNLLHRKPTGCYYRRTSAIQTPKGHDKSFELRNFRVLESNISPLEFL